MGRGYFMMDSPGNDLESIAGQVRATCVGVGRGTGALTLDHGVCGCAWSHSHEWNACLADPSAVARGCMA